MENRGQANSPERASLLRWALRRAHWLWVEDSLSLFSLQEQIYKRVQLCGSHVQQQRSCYGEIHVHSVHPRAHVWAFSCKTRKERKSMKEQNQRRLSEERPDICALSGLRMLTIDQPTHRCSLGLRFRSSKIQWNRDSFQCHWRPSLPSVSHWEDDQSLEQHFWELGDHEGPFVVSRRRKQSKWKRRTKDRDQIRSTLECILNVRDSESKKRLTSSASLLATVNLRSSSSICLLRAGSSFDLIESTMVCFGIIALISFWRCCQPGRSFFASKIASGLLEILPLNWNEQRDRIKGWRSIAQWERRRKSRCVTSEQSQTKLTWSSTICISESLTPRLQASQTWFDFNFLSSSLK